MNFEVFLLEWLVGSKYISASIAPFFDSRNILLRAPSVGGGGRKVEGMDREGSISHDPLMLSFARFKLIKLEGLIIGTVERRSVPRVDIDDIVDKISVLLSRYGGGELLCCSFRVQKNKSSKLQNLKHTESTGDRGPLSFTSAAQFFVSELESWEVSSGTMIILVKCKCGWKDSSIEFDAFIYNSVTASESRIGAVWPTAQYA